MANPIIDGIAHVAYNTKDMKKSLDFYCGVLGFTHAFSINKEDGSPWIEYLKIAKGQFMELFYTQPETEFTSGQMSYNHLCLCVSDIFAVQKTLEDTNWPIDSQPKQGRDKNWQLWIKDPDGNRIELMQIAPDSRQANA